MKKEQVFLAIGLVDDEFIKEAEEERIVRQGTFWNSSRTKWAAVAAGILLVIGVKISQQVIGQNELTKQDAGAGSFLTEMTAKTVSIDDGLPAFYFHIIETAYQDFGQECFFYVNLDEVTNLTVEQKEEIKVLLAEKFGDKVQIRQEQGVEILTDDQMNEMQTETFYFTIQVEDEEENCFYFSIAEQGEEGEIKNSYIAEYEESGWQYHELNAK